MRPRTLTYKRWSGGSRRVEGVASVEFGPAHVVFRDAGDSIVLAERVEQVNELRETTDDRCGDDACTDDHGSRNG